MAGGDYNLGTARGTIELNAASLGRASSALDHVANRMLLVGGAAVAGLGYAVKAAGDFEQQMSRFQAVSNSTQGEMDAIRKKALQLGQDSAYGATEVITAFAELGYAGVSVKEILGGVGDAVVYLAAAAEIPLKDAATALVNTMRQFAIPASGAKEAVNELARAANASTVDMADLITSLRYAGPVAAALNIPLNDVAETLAILGNNGIRGSTAGTSLRGILIGLTPTSDKAAAAMAKLGLITEDGTNLFFDATGKLKSMSEVAQILHDHTANLTDEQKKQAFTTIFQRRAMASALTLARGGAAAYDQLAHSAQYNTTAQELMRKKLDNMKGAFKILKASVETFAITIGEQLTPFLKKAADKLKDVTNWFIRLSPQTKKWIVLAVGGIGGLLVFLGVILKIGKGIIGMYKALKDLGTGLKIVANILKTTIAADPWILALIGIAAAIIYLYNASPQFRKFVDDFISKLGELEVAFGGWIGDTFGSPEAKKFLHDFLHELGKVEIGFINFIGNTFGSNTAKTFLHDFLHTLGGVEVGFADFMLNTFGSPQAKTFLHDFLHTLGGVEVGFADFMLKTFGSHTAKVFLHDFLYELGKIEVGLVQLGAKFVSFVADNVAKFIGGLVGLVGKIAEIDVKMVEAGFNLLNSLAKGLVSGFVAVAEFFTNLPSNLVTFFGDAANWLVEAGRTIVYGLWNGAIQLLALVGGFFAGLGDWLVNKMDDAIHWLEETGKQLIRGLWEGIKGQLGWLIDKIKDFVGNVIDHVLSFFGIGSPSKVFAEIGGHLVTGLAKGIKDNAYLAKAAYDSLSPENLGASFAYSVAGAGATPAVAAGPASVAAAVPGSAGLGGVEDHLRAISGHLADQGGWGDTTINVLSRENNPTLTGMEMVRKLKGVGRRTNRSNHIKDKTGKHNGKVYVA